MNFFSKWRTKTLIFFSELLYSIEPLEFRNMCQMGDRGQATPRNHQVWWFDREQRKERGCLVYIKLKEGREMKNVCLHFRWTVPHISIHTQREPKWRIWEKCIVQVDTGNTKQRFTWLYLLLCGRESNIYCAFTHQHRRIWNYIYKTQNVTCR